MVAAGKRTAMKVLRLSCLLLILFLVFSHHSIAQVEADGHFSPITKNFCGMKVCEEEFTAFLARGVDFPEAIDPALAENKHIARYDFYLKNDAPAERNSGLPAINQDAGAHSDRNDRHSSVEKTMAGNGPLPDSYSTFRYEDKGLGARLLRASLFVHSSQVANLLLMVQFPDAFNYSCGSWDEAKSNLHRAWTTAPVWDKDHWLTNFIGHPYVGVNYYNMMRSQGSSVATSYLYSTGQSLLWEFVIEAVAEQPSIQDLIFTSNLGSVFGELSHRAVLRMGRNGFSPFEKILTILINPSHVLNNGFHARRR